MAFGDALRLDGCVALVDKLELEKGGLQDETVDNLSVDDPHVDVVDNLSKPLRFDAVDTEPRLGREEQVFRQSSWSKSSDNLRREVGWTWCVRASEKKLKRSPAAISLHSWGVRASEKKWKRSSAAMSLHPSHGSPDR
jgi:hypothetical protein